MSKHEDIFQSVCKNNIEELTRLWDENQISDFTGSTFNLQSSALDFIEKHLILQFREEKRIIPLFSLTLLHIAAFYNSLQAFIFLQNKGIHINTPIEGQYLPIHYACISGSYEVVEYILSIDPSQATASPSVEFNQVFLAAVTRNADILRLLIKKGAGAKFKYLNKYIENNELECLKVFLENGAKLENENNFSLLMFAILCSNFEAFKMIIEHGADLEYTTRDTHDTPLSIACLLGQVEMVKYLCDRMENVDIDPSIQCKAAVHWICQSKSVEIVKIVLAKGIDVNRLDQDGNTGVFGMIDITDEDTTIQIIELLFNAGLDLNIQGRALNGREAETILGSFVSSIHRQVRVIEWLLNHGASPKATLVSQKKPIVDFILSSRNRNLRSIFKKCVPEIYDEALSKLNKQ